MSRNLTVLLSVLILTVGFNLPTAYSTSQPELTRKEKNQIKNIVKKLLHVKLGKKDGKRVVRFVGINVQIVNGLGSTVTKDGTGNLIVGYDESLMPGEKTGSHNLVVGPNHEYAASGGVVFGDTNSITADFATVTGGFNHLASGIAASIGGGDRNTASGLLASVAGGVLNEASGERASIGGGSFNEASGAAASVTGGFGNRAAGAASSVVGGESNTASGESASVTGGSNNQALGSSASVSGGGQ